MKITWPDSGTPICDGATRAENEAAGPADLFIRCQPGLIRRDWADGGGPKFEATDNDAASVSFGVTILCADLAAAAALAAAIAVDTARTGTLALEDGLSLENAGLETITARQRGLRVIVEYSFVGRAIPAEAGGPPP